MNSNISLKTILNSAKVSNDIKEIVVKKLRLILSFPASPDSQPADYYRYLGQWTIKLQLIHELNNFINARYSKYHYVIIWYKELAELKESTEKMIELCRKMIRGLLQEGIQTGRYPNIIL